MNYCNMDIASLSSYEMLESTPSALGTWLMLLRFCMIQENHGRIKNAASWSERSWQNVAHVDHEELQKPSSLWVWKGPDLIVKFYPNDHERIMLAKRRGGKLGADRKKQKAEAARSPEGVLAGVPPADPAGVLIRKERKGKERKDKGETRAQEDPPNRNPEVRIPSLSEFLGWAATAGVDPAWAERRWNRFEEDKAWVRHGQVVAWQPKAKREFETDRVEGRWPLNRPAKNGAQRSLYAINKDLESVEAEIREHPKMRLAAGQELTPAELESWERLKARYAALKTEKANWVNPT